MRSSGYHKMYGEMLFLFFERNKRSKLQPLQPSSNKLAQYFFYLYGNFYEEEQVLKQQKDDNVLIHLMFDVIKESQERYNSLLNVNYLLKRSLLSSVGITLMLIITYMVKL